MAIGEYMVGRWVDQALAAYRERTKVEQNKADAMGRLADAVSNGTFDLVQELMEHRD